MSLKKSVGVKSEQKKGYEEFTDQTVWMGIKKVIDNINVNAVA